VFFILTTQYNTWHFQAIRVAAVQSSNMLANYLQDQLQADFAREELVKDGKLTAKKADEQQEEWEQVRRYLFTWRDTTKAMMERVVRPLLKSYLRFATPEERFSKLNCRAFVLLMTIVAINDPNWCCF
jgi:hypothetical protein